MNKKILRLGLMAVSLIVLCGVYFATLNKPDENEQVEAPVSGFFLVDALGRELASFELKNSDEFVFMRTSEKWNMEGHSDFRLSDMNVSAAAAAVMSLYGQDTVSGGDLAAFGLLEPKSIATLNFSDGYSSTIYVGNATVDGKFYYAMAEGDDTVYTISKTAGDKFFNGYNEFLSKGLPQVTLTELEELVFRIKGNEYSFINGMPYGVEYIGWFREIYIDALTNGSRRLDNEYAYSSIYNGVNDIRLTGVVMDAVDIESYGFNESCNMLKVYDGENTLHFYVGNDAGNGLRYIMLEGEDYIYTAKTGYFAKLDGAEPSAVFDRRLTDVIPKQAQTVSLTGPGYEKNIKPQENDIDKKAYATVFELTWDSIIEPWSISGKAPIWTMDIDGLVASGDINAKQLKNSDGNYEKQDDGSISYSAKYELYDYNELFYAVSRDGKEPQTVMAKDRFDKIMEAVK